MSDVSDPGSDPGGEARADSPRHIDPDRGTLEGIGAGQRVDGEATGFPTTTGAERRRPDLAVPADSPTYYDQPAIKEPVWIWSVPAYLFVGGAAAGAAVLGAVAQVADREDLAGLVRRSRDLAMAGTVLSTGFLIHDLGRPVRFLNMLRVFRPSSAMSMGSWTLAAIGTASGAASVLPRLGLHRLGDLAGLGSGVLGPPLGTYTAVLLSDTAVPVWQAPRRQLPALFAASGLVAATSTLDLFEQRPRERDITHRLGVIAKSADLVAGEMVERAADDVERVGRPLHEGASGAMWKAAKACTVASLAASVVPVPPRWRRVRRRLAAVLGLTGSATLRFALFHAGMASSRDPRATFDQQRAGRGAAEVTGTSGVIGPGSQRA